MTVASDFSSWVEELPSSWKVVRVKFCLRDGREGSRIGPFGSALPLSEMVAEGYKVYGQENVITNDFSVGGRFIPEAKFNEMEAYSIFPQDILITMMGTVGQCRIVPEGIKKGIIDSHLLRLRTKLDLIDNCYFEWVIGESNISKEQAEIMSKGSIMSGLNSGTVRDMLIPLPPIKTQRLIARFLDRKTAAIDTLIAKKQRLIQLLEEKRTALINQAVTKGLNPNAPMKDSGIPWIGEIPEHWEARRLKFALHRIVDCKNRTPVYVDDGEYAVVRTTNIRQGKFLFENLLRTDQANYEEWTQREVPQAGHVIFTREAPAGEACKVPESLKLCLGQRTMLFMPNEKILTSDFLLLSIYGGGVDGFVKSVSSGSTVSHLRIEQVGDLPIFIPPLNEQEPISKEVQSRLTNQEKLINKTQRSIEKLQEYRRSLITAAVTGKLDIHNLNQEA